jgi:hypothetical protein
VNKRNNVFGIMLGAMLLLASCQPRAPVSVSVTAPTPSPNKTRLLNYLEANYGKHIIAGQIVYNHPYVITLDKLPDLTK